MNLSKSRIRELGALVMPFSVWEVCSMDTSGHSGPWIMTQKIMEKWVTIRYKSKIISKIGFK